MSKTSTRNRHTGRINAAKRAVLERHNESRRDSAGRAYKSIVRHKVLGDPDDPLLNMAGGPRATLVSRQTVRDFKAEARQ